MTLKRRPLYLAMAAGLAATSPSIVLAVPSTNCPQAVSNTITVPNGFTVVATETYGCSLNTGESIVVQTGGAIDFDQPAYFNEPTFGLAGIFVPDGVSAGSVDIDGTVSIGDVNSRHGVLIGDGASLSGNIDVSGTITVLSPGSANGIFARGDVNGIYVSGTIEASRYAIYFNGAGTQAIPIYVSETGTLRGAIHAVDLLGDFGAGTTTMPAFANAGYLGPSNNFGGGVYLSFDKRIASFTNASTGVIEAKPVPNGVAVSGVGITGRSSITTFTNEGTIRASDGGDGIEVGGASDIGTITNAVGGVIESINQGAGIYVNGMITTLNNRGTMSGAVAGIQISDYGYYYTYYGRIDTLVNVGTIEGGVFDIDTPMDRGPTDDAPIGTLVNLQSGLTYRGMLPENYEIVIEDDSTYGSFVVSGAYGLMSFGISDDGDVQELVYPNVLDGVTEEQLTALSGTVGSYGWSLLSTDDPTEWDLCVGSACPGGLLPKPVPVMGPWMVAFLSALTGLMGLFGVSRRRSSSVAR
jgi:hypothetical protein